MIKVTLVCDACDAVIADGISANEVRFQAEGRYRRREGKDLCLTCGVTLRLYLGRSGSRESRPADVNDLAHPVAPDEEPGSAGGEARGGGAVGQTEVA